MDVSKFVENHLIYINKKLYEYNYYDYTLKKKNNNNKENAQTVLYYYKV